MFMPNGPAAVIGLERKARGGVITPVSACASGNEGIAHAWRQIAYGDADIAICGGIEAAIEAAPIAAFANMRIVMSTDNDNPAGASRPFDKNRTGFVFGEGGALMVIETEEHAKARGARIYARLLGAGITSDGFHVVAPHPDGIGAAKAMNRALKPPVSTPRTSTTSTRTPPRPASVTSPRAGPFTSPVCSTPRSTHLRAPSGTPSVRSAPSRPSSR